MCFELSGCGGGDRNRHKIYMYFLPFYKHRSATLTQLYLLLIEDTKLIFLLSNLIMYVKV